MSSDTSQKCTFRTGPVAFIWNGILPAAGSTEEKVFDDLIKKYPRPKSNNPEDYGMYVDNRHARRVERAKHVNTKEAAAKVDYDNDRFFNYFMFPDDDGPPVATNNSTLSDLISFTMQTNMRRSACAPFAKHFATNGYLKMTAKPIGIAAVALGFDQRDGKVKIGPLVSAECHVACGSVGHQRMQEDLVDGLTLSRSTHREHMGTQRRWSVLLECNGQKSILGLPHVKLLASEEDARRDAQWDHRYDILWALASKANVRGGGQVRASYSWSPLTPDWIKQLRDAEMTYYTTGPNNSCSGTHAGEARAHYNLRPFPTAKASDRAGLSRRRIDALTLFERGSRSSSVEITGEKIMRHASSRNGQRTGSKRKRAEKEEKGNFETSLPDNDATSELDQKRQEAANIDFELKTATGLEKKFLEQHLVCVKAVITRLEQEAARADTGESENTEEATWAEKILDLHKAHETQPSTQTWHALAKLAHRLWPVMLTGATLENALFLLTSMRYFKKRGDDAQFSTLLLAYQELVRTVTPAEQLHEHTLDPWSALPKDEAAFEAALAVLQADERLAAGESLEVEMRNGALLRRVVAEMERVRGGEC